MRKKKTRAVPAAIGQAVAERTTDPWLSGLWHRLPNPDVVLEKLGRDQTVFDQILFDAHVIGELRAVRAGLLGYEWRIVPGGESRAAKRATELAHMVMAAPPNAMGSWGDVIWTAAMAVFRGYAVHNVVWARRGEFILPETIIDRPQRRFVFNANDNALRVLNKSAAGDGVPVAPRQVLLTRHMPTFDNPYGMAVLSTCLWPYLFKHAGFKFFTQFTEKFGVPFMVAKHPPGWNSDQVDTLLEALQSLTSSGVGAVEDGVEMMPMAHGAAGGAAAATPQERLIRACNLELSKALTSQTLATEVQGQGSRAASETHMERERSVHVSDRAMVSETFNTLFRWITDINFGADVPAPKHEFYEEDQARTEWADLFVKIRDVVPLSITEVYGRLGLTRPTEEGDVLAPPAAVHTESDSDRGGGLKMKKCPGCGQVHEFRLPTNPGGGGDDEFYEAAREVLGDLEGVDADAIGEAVTRGLVEAAAENPAALQTELKTLQPDIDAEALAAALARLIFLGEMLGRAKAAGEDDNG